MRLLSSRVGLALTLATFGSSIGEEVISEAKKRGMKTICWYEYTG